jgi:hypothetical protein
MIKKSLIATAVALSTSAEALSAPVSADDGCRPNYVEYQQLHSGQSLTDVQAIMQCVGIEMSSSETAGIKSVIQTFGDAFNGGIVTVMLTNGKLISKSQMGLEPSVRAGSKGSKFNE